MVTKETRGMMRVPMSLLLGLATALSGCVSSAKYELARKDAEHARMLYQRESDRTGQLTEQVKQMKQRLEELDAKLQEAQEEARRAGREYKDVRDELLRLKIAQEQSRHQAKERLKHVQRLLEKEKAMIETEAGLTNEPGPVSEQSHQRIRRLLEEMRGLLSTLEEPSRP